MPELSLDKCRQYSIGKDSFTEIVLLTVIAYFCVSTEQRFINMSIEKEQAMKENNLNNSINSQQNSNKSSGGINSNNLSSKFEKSTKAQSSLQKTSITETKTINLTHQQSH